MKYSRFYSGGFLAMAAAVLLNTAWAAEDPGEKKEAHAGQAAAHRPEGVADLTARVEELRGQAAATADRLKVKALQAEEALALASLVAAGDEDRAERMDALAGRLRTDPDLPLDTRYSVAAASANSRILGDRQLTREQRLRAFESAAWQLAKDFPESPRGHEALLRIARDSDEREGRMIAERVGKEAASEEIRSRARFFLDRLDLQGRRLTDIAPDGFNINVATCIYSWRAQGPALASLRKWLDGLPPGTDLIGICTDTDIEVAQAMAAEAQLPGRLYFDPRGVNADLCQRLAIDAPGLIYVVESSGKILSVNGRRHYAKLNQERGGFPADRR